MNMLVKVQVCLVALAAVISVAGVIRAMPDYARVIVYAAQAIVCVCIAVLGIGHIKDDDFRHFRIVVNVYACFEALRAALLNTNEVPFWGCVSGKIPARYPGLQLRALCRETGRLQKLRQSELRSHPV